MDEYKKIKKTLAPPKEKKEKDPDAPKQTRLSLTKKQEQIVILSKELKEMESYTDPRAMEILKLIQKYHKAIMKPKDPKKEKSQEEDLQAPEHVPLQQ